MTLKQRVKALLESEPKARERRYRYRAVWKILHDIYHKDTWGQETFLIVGPEIGSVIRLINQFQQHNKELRGIDYDDKKKLVQAKQIELGYEPGYHQDVKKLKALIPREDELNDETY